VTKAWCHIIIFILEDDEDRTASMQHFLRALYAEYQVVIIDNAPDAITWLTHHLSEAALLCLDHDLGPNREYRGEVFDPGIGRDVVEYLVTRPPVCPVIVHSTNSPAAYGMKVRLREAKWKCSRVIPFNDLEWVEVAWLRKVRRYLGPGKQGP
jgi:hypothetical protein